MIPTIEQILGIHPMNQKDSAATPMAAAFTQQANLKPFNALVANRTSLTDALAPPPVCGVDIPRAAGPQGGGSAFFECAH